MAAFDNFRLAKRFRRGNRFLQIVLSLTLVVGINYLAARYYTRIDLTRDQQFSLSPETVAYLKKMVSPVDIIVTYTPEANSVFFNFVQNLLKEYTIQSRLHGEDMVRVEYVNIYQQRRRARELVVRYGIQEENQIVVVSGDRQVEISRTDLFEVEGNEVTAFTGEEAFTSAILAVSNPDQPKIYFTSGHGERLLADVDPVQGLSELTQFLQEKNYSLETLDLQRASAIPEEADLVVMAGPKAGINPREVEKLRIYLSEKNGRLLLLLDPYINHDLEDLLFDWGVLVDDMVLYDPGPDSVSSGGDTVIRRFAEHPVTQFLIDYQLTCLFGTSRPVRPDPGAPWTNDSTSLPSSAPPKPAWAERRYRTENPPAFTDDSDLRGPITIATLAERRVGEALDIFIPGGRLAVFGNSDFIANNRINAFGNRILFLNTIKWAIDETTQLNLTPKTVRTYKLVLSEAELQTVLLYLLSVPLGVGLLGFVVFAIRRR
jgi:ABC-type uncharacterized transport system involved in gliding motility auxiliary subunit